jgi:hypothetical protein
MCISCNNESPSWCCWCDSRFHCEAHCPTFFAPFAGYHPCHGEWKPTEGEALALVGAKVFDTRGDSRLIGGIVEATHNEARVRVAWPTHTDIARVRYLARLS